MENPPEGQTLLPCEERKRLVSKVVEGPFMIMDSKEFSKNPLIVESLRGQGITVECYPLKAGDYWIPAPEGKDMLIERKTATDMLRTLRENRFWDQLKALASLPDVKPILLLEGSPTLIQKFSSWNENSITQILWAILDFSVDFMFTPSRRWTGISLGGKCKSMCAEKKYRIYPLRVKVNREFTEDESARFLVEGLPQISGVLAARLLDHFKTPVKVFNADEAELRQIDGLGPKKAKKILETLHHEYSPKKKEREEC